jgi:LysM repeat protein
MNTPSPLIPQGSLLEQKNRSRSRVKVAFFCVVGAHLLGLMVLLIQGCKREPAPPPPEPILPTLAETNLPPVVDSNLPPPPTNVVAPPQVEVPPPPPPQPAVQEYVVQKGDTFDSIGRKFGVSWKAIQDANPNVNPTRLQIGQKIVIPAPGAGGAARPAGAETAAPSGGERIYIVKSGDTLTKIAKDHGTTVKALRAANKLRTDRIRVGDKLVIPAGAAPSAPSAPEAAPAPAPAPAPPPVYNPPPTSARPSPTSPPPGR